MKKNIWKRKTLDAFSVSVDELEEFCSQLQQEFANGDDVSTSIEFQFSDETLEFASADDIRNQDIIYDRATRFKITMHTLSQDNKYLCLESEGLSIISSGAAIRSSSPRESWCVGVNEAIASHLKNKRVWYFWLTRRGVWLSFGIAVPASIIFLPAVPAYRSLSSNWQVLTFVSLLALWVLFLFGKHWFFPGGTIRISQKRWDIKTVATVVGAFASVIIAIIWVIQIMTGGD